jgi:hypothetical protein
MYKKELKVRVKNQKQTNNKIYKQNRYCENTGMSRNIAEIKGDTHVWIK